MDNVTFDVPLWLIIQVIAATILPLVVGFVTARVADSGLKATILLALSTVTSLLTELGDALQTDTPYNLGSALVFAIGTFATGVALHYGFYRQVGATDAVQSHGLQLGGDGKHEKI